MWSLRFFKYKFLCGFFFWSWTTSRFQASQYVYLLLLLKGFSFFLTVFFCVKTCIFFSSEATYLLLWIAVPSHYLWYIIQELDSRNWYLTYIRDTEHGLAKCSLMCRKYILWSVLMFISSFPFEFPCIFDLCHHRHTLLILMSLQQLCSCSGLWTNFAETHPEFVAPLQPNSFFRLVCPAESCFQFFSLQLEWSYFIFTECER